MSKLGFGGKNIIDIIKYRYLWLGISGMLVIPCICFMVFSIITTPSHAPVKLGIDFTGGTFLQYGFEQKMEVKDLPKIREVLAKAGQENPILQIQEPTEILGDLSGVNTKKDSKSSSQTSEEMPANEDISTDTNEIDDNSEASAEEDTNTATEEDSNVEKESTNTDNIVKSEDKEKTKQTAEKKDETKTEDIKSEDVKTENNDKTEKTTTTSEDKTDTTSENKDVNEDKTLEEEKTSEDVEKNNTEELEEANTEDSDATTDSLSADKVKTVISMRVKFLDEKELKNLNTVLKENFGKFSIIQVSAIGPSLGKELLHNAMIALLLVFGGIVIYLSVRFQVDYAVCALLTLFHDAIFVIGIFALLGILFNTEVDSLFVTAVLTVIGFSVHDSIVVFDRIRENARFLSKKKTFNEICNDSVNQTLARSINTSLTTIFVLLCLYFLGGVTTKDFVLAMTIGIAVGTYSSIFVASVLLAFWRDINAPKKRKRKVSTT